MGMKVKGGMYCPQCQSPVPAQKSTHRFRNVASTIMLPATFGYSAMGYAADGWHCQRCGGPVYEVRKIQQAQKNAQLAATPVSQWSAGEQRELMFGVLVVIAIIVAIIVAIV